MNISTNRSPLRGLKTVQMFLSYKQDASTRLKNCSNISFLRKGRLHEAQNKMILVPLSLRPFSPVL